MKMHELGEGGLTVTKRPKKYKPEPYYPSVSIEGAKDLGAHPVGKKLKIVGEGVIARHSEEKSRDGVKLRTTIDLHRIGVHGGGKKDTSHVCPECGKGGAAGYCDCGAKRMQKRGK